jgi:hypothetical protein
MPCTALENIPDVQQTSGFIFCLKFTDLLLYFWGATPGSRDFSELGIDHHFFCWR